MRTHIIYFPNSLMKVVARFAFAVLAPVALAVLALAANTTATKSDPVAQLAFLTGHWRGTAADGHAAEEIISTPEGGVLLCTGREFERGKCVFFDLVVFVEKAGVLTLIPHPNGKLSPHTFPATSDATAKRAVFENAAHDFPKKFVYELIAPDHLRITLTGTIKGESAEDVFDLKRVP